MQFGVPFHYPGESPGELLPFYRDLGFDEVDVLMARPEIQVDDSVRALVAQAREAGVPAGAVSPRWGWIARAMKDPSQIRQMQAFVEAAPELGTSRVMMSCPSATIRSAAERDEHLRHVAAVYRQVTRVAEAVGVDLCTHTSAQKDDTLFSTVDGIDAFLDAVGSPRNKLLACCGCLAVAGWDVPALIRHWGSAIGAVHVFNPLGNRERYDEMRLDLGQLDVPAALHALHAVGFDGAVIAHEYPRFGGAHGQPASDAWVAGYLRGVWQTISPLGRKPTRYPPP